MLLTLAALFIVLSIVVFVHELGHFAVAKLNRIFVVTFSFGFGPKILKKKVGETEYALSALPFGGYVKFAGEIAEEEGKERDAATDIDVPPERMYCNKAPLQRMSVVLAGPVMNLLLALLIYIFALYIGGSPVDPGLAIGEMNDGSPAMKAGLKVGDAIIEINGIRVLTWGQIHKALAAREGTSSRYTILRGGDTLRIDVQPAFDTEEDMWRIGISAVPWSSRIGDIRKGSPAEQAGLRRGAMIIAINDTTVTKYIELEDRIRPRLGIPMKFTWSYEGEVYSKVITPTRGEAPAEGERIDVKRVGDIGVLPYYEKVRISFADAVIGGTQEFTYTFEAIIDFLVKLFSGKATVRAVGGPVRIGIMAGEMIRWGFERFVSFIAFVSLNLGIFNLLPILPFDGGHFVIGLAETVTRRKMGAKVQQVFGQIGFVILIILIVLIFSLDLFNVFR